MIPKRLACIRIPSLPRPPSPDRRRPGLPSPPPGRGGEREHPRPKVKDVLLAADLGADYLGLNFYPPSPRCVYGRQAREIAEAVRGRCELVGVFVNHPRRSVEEAIERVGLDLVQFHGDEEMEEIMPFARRAIKVVRVRDRFDASVAAGWDDFWGLLVDTAHPRLYGGSGDSWDFASLGAQVHRRIFVAGGLGPDNVAAALAVRPFGIDLCSGVEARPGRKDSALLERLFKEIDHGESHSAP